MVMKALPVTKVFGNPSVTAEEVMARRKAGSLNKHLEGTLGFWQIFQNSMVTPTISVS
ncbi:hypothetical protein Cflav_PD2186 [Pedosphaera parvula Ellin514]|uniref:Uncharacterized protein n=1 Tax=Pedosphaera parvula (strain Ellin514) TaxID=320771 RepID=B9XM66_PEDPL|nr:hypothetical protein Cflav_PD2186 [Pedosphaera parvula Ellin514]